MSGSEDINVILGKLLAKSEESASQRSRMWQNLSEIQKAQEAFSRKLDKLGDDVDHVHEDLMDIKPVIADYKKKRNIGMGLALGAGGVGGAGFTEIWGAISRWLKM